MDKKLRQALRQSYDQNVAIREKQTVDAWKLTARNEFAVLLQGEGKKSLLEIGAGTGYDSAYFQDQGFAVTSIDLAEENVKACRQKGLKAEVMDVCRLQFAPASFTAVYSLNCLLHLPKPELPRALRAIHTVLQPGGLFYLGIYGGYDFADVWAEDTYEPKRFFSFHTDADLLGKLQGYFQLLSFRRIEVDARSPELHFQAFTLRKSRLIAEE